MQKIKELQGKKIAIVGLGKSWFDFALARTNGTPFDEVWAINAVGNVIYHDRDSLIAMMQGFKPMVLKKC